MKDAEYRKFQVHVAKKTFMDVKRRCKKKKISMSSYIRELLIRELAKEITDAS